MSGYLIDLFFSFRGRISRREWVPAAVALALAAAGGVLLFNDDSFDESLHAVRGTPTMAAFLWVALCLFALTALSTKRLRDSGHSSLLTYAVPAAGAAAILGWGLGFFPTPLTITNETLALWGLIALTLPALIACATLPTEKGG